MTNFKITSGLIFIALINGVASQCWQFDSSFSGWLANGWQQAPNQVPDTSSIEYYNPPTAAYSWMQEQVSPPKVGSLTSPTVTIDHGDIVSATFYRHMSVMDGTDRINMTFVTSNNIKLLILWTENYDVWDTVSTTCSPSNANCCPSYPCTGHFVIDGSILDEGDLVAVNHVGINCNAPPTTSSSRTSAVPTTAFIPTEQTSVTSTITTRVTTSAPSTEKPTTSIETSTFVSPTPTISTPRTTIATSPTDGTTPTTAATTSGWLSTVTSETSGTYTTDGGETTTGIPSGYCCSFDYDVCQWSIAVISNGWHWSEYKQPAIPPPFTSGYIWLEDASAGVGSPNINGVSSGTTFHLTYDFQTTDVNKNNANVTFRNVQLGMLIANEGVQTFNHTCRDECCGNGTTCSGNFAIEAHNEPEQSLSISIDDFFVDGYSSCV